MHGPSDMGPLPLDPSPWPTEPPPLFFTKVRRLLFFVSEASASGPGAPCPWTPGPRGGSVGRPRGTPLGTPLWKVSRLSFLRRGVLHLCQALAPAPARRFRPRPARGTQNEHEPPVFGPFQGRTERVVVVVVDSAVSRVDGTKVPPSGNVIGIHGAPFFGFTGGKRSKKRNLRSVLGVSGRDILRGVFSRPGNSPR